MQGVITVQRRPALDIDMKSTLETFRVSDLRGSAVPPSGESTILEDPTGRRRRLMRLAGRAVAVILSLWLAALLFAGIGVGPLANIPFARIVHPSAALPALPTSLRPTPPTAADLKPARPAKQIAGLLTSAPPVANAQPPTTTGQGGTRPRTSPGKGAPQATTAPAPSSTRRSQASPTGQVRGGGKNTTSSSTTTTTTTTPGRSGVAPGQSRLPGSTSGH